jgi:hypothetical protein
VTYALFKDAGVSAVCLFTDHLNRLPTKADMPLLHPDLIIQDANRELATPKSAKISKHIPTDMDEDIDGLYGDADATMTDSFAPQPTVPDRKSLPKTLSHWCVWCTDKGDLQVFTTLVDVVSRM